MKAPWKALLRDRVEARREGDPLPSGPPRAKQRGPTPERFCECGNKKQGRRVEGCARCRRLDGVGFKMETASVTAADVIAALRSMSGTATPEAVRMYVGAGPRVGSRSSSPERQLQRVLRRLEKQGRVRRIRWYWADDSEPPTLALTDRTA